MKKEKATLEFFKQVVLSCSIYFGLLKTQLAVSGWTLCLPASEQPLQHYFSKRKKEKKESPPSSGRMQKSKGGEERAVYIPLLFCQPGT
ncbi:hypothetical protein [Cecembia calidifontis]|uniref:hypothetical protein n=1 Tax=Cecembia calidifontis TaxID=1187080 RepID=UPI00102A6766|nr:hypothetical protein [Cecembia calidifontis]